MKLDLLEIFISLDRFIIFSRFNATFYRSYKLVKGKVKYLNIIEDYVLPLMFKMISDIFPKHIWVLYLGEMAAVPLWTDLTFLQVVILVYGYVKYCTTVYIVVRVFWSGSKTMKPKCRKEISFNIWNPSKYHYLRPSKAHKNIV